MMQNPAGPQRILAICSARIGDTLLFTPCLRALKQTYPQAQLCVLAHPKRKELLESLDFIDELKPLSSWRLGLARWWSTKNFDLAVVYGDDPRLVDFALSQAQQAVAFSEHSRAGLIAVTRANSPEHAVLERLRLAQAVGAHSQNWALAYQVSSAETAWAQTWWQHQQLDRAERVIGIQVASFPTKAYRDWPLKHFIGVLEWFLADYPQAKVIVLGDNASIERGRQLQQRFAGSIVNAAGRFSLRQNAAVMARLDLYLGVDTGPTHLAGALGVPMVALYHPRHPGYLLAPLQHARLAVIEHPALGVTDDPQTPMADIKPERVWHEVQQLLLVKDSL